MASAITRCSVNRATVVAIAAVAFVLLPSIAAARKTPEVCPNANSNALCRPKAGKCDAPEHCNKGECPADMFINDASKPCREADPANPCDVAEYCTGFGVDCPANAGKPDGTLCTIDGSAGHCQDSVCIPHGVCYGLGPDDVCRPAYGECDAIEKCTGLGDVCPDDQFQPDGTVCQECGSLSCECVSGTCTTVVSRK